MEEKKQLIGEKEFKEFDNWLYNKVTSEMMNYNPENEKKRALAFMFGIRERIEKVLGRNPPEEVFGNKDRKIREKRIKLLQKTIILEINQLKERIKMDIQEDKIGGPGPSYIGYIG